ncbi:mediator of RNA polymerase II transcription subunit 1-domain-containing protein [Syncephalastrum racemosum]|uniref:Mediator of RNA polymerase II transcription subunit 1 n=1 Tax=Syncephalastrum racemosum TaxID=13706 RepID=A0A1X2HHN6_SYNRA|nr:mediator of RNA polymerase II transcription subunit 1-domain-containing protein [Syncephalastrum racemosum]
MASSPPATGTKKSIAESVYALQQQMTRFKEQLTVIQKDGNGNEADLHGLGPMNLSECRRQFAHEIDTIRSICSQFETQVLNDVIKMGAGADPAFRKHFTHLKEQAASESTVRRVTGTLTKTKELLEQTLSERESSPVKRQTHLLEKLAQQAGLVTFVDHESNPGTTTITLGGTVIVIDIDIDNHGHVLRTKASYVSEVLQSDHDDRVDRLLAKNLQAHGIDRFERNLHALALPDKLNVKHPSTDFFLVIRGLLTDFETIFDQELLFFNNEVSDILMEGHGVPCRHLDYPGLSIAYFIDKRSLLETDWTALQSSSADQSGLLGAARLLISFEEAETPQSFLPAGRKQFLLPVEETDEECEEDGKHTKVVRETVWPLPCSPLRFAQASASASDAVPVRFVAKLDPPMAASHQALRFLMVAAGLPTPAEVPITEPAMSISLEKMLAEGEVKGATWTAEFEDVPDQIYKWAGTQETMGKTVTRIPFTHPVQLYSILRCLRQQQMFNTLFTSITRNTSSQHVREQNQKEQLAHTMSLDEIMEANEETTPEQVHLSMTSLDAPRALDVALNLPLQLTGCPLLAFSIRIPLESPTRPTVSLHSPVPDANWHPDFLDEGTLTRVIQAGYSVPLLVRWIWKRLQRHTGQFLLRSASPADDAHDYKRMRLE